MLKSGNPNVPFGENFVGEGTEFELTWSSGAKTTITSGFTASGVNTKVLGPQTATITYETFSVTYNVKVTNQVVASDLFISEYIEGSGNNKAIELYNGTGEDIDLNGYEIDLYSNGSSSSSQNLELTGTLANGKTIQVVNADATPEFKVGTYIESTVTYFNGDDAFALSKNGVKIDVFGVIGFDPGSSWTVGSGNTVNHTLVRKGTVNGPSATVDWAEWDVHPEDTATYLGAHSIPNTNVFTYEEQATAFANYVNSGIGLNAEGNCEVVLTELENEYNFMTEDAQLEFETSPDAVFESARVRFAYLQAWVAANVTPPGRTSIKVETNNVAAITLIGIIGLSTLVGYYFINKKD
ncbi:MAG: lamin tail domain-containing protein [Methanofastidiosum sp.]